VLIPEPTDIQVPMSASVRKPVHTAVLISVQNSVTDWYDQLIIVARLV